MSLEAIDLREKNLLIINWNQPWTHWKTNNVEIFAQNLILLEVSLIIPKILSALRLITVKDAS